MLAMPRTAYFLLLLLCLLWLSWSRRVKYFSRYSLLVINGGVTCLCMVSTVSIFDPNNTHPALDRIARRSSPALPCDTLNLCSFGYSVRTVIGQTLLRSL